MVPRVTHCEAVRYALEMYHAMPRFLPTSEPLKIPCLCPITDFACNGGNVMVDLLPGLCYECSKTMVLQQAVRNKVPEGGRNTKEARVITAWVREEKRKSGENVKENLIMAEETHEKTFSEADTDVERSKEVETDEVIKYEGDIDEAAKESAPSTDDYVYTGPMILRPGSN